MDEIGLAESTQIADGKAMLCEDAISRLTTGSFKKPTILGIAFKQGALTPQMSMKKCLELAIKVRLRSDNRTLAPFGSPSSSSWRYITQRLATTTTRSSLGPAATLLHLPRSPRSLAKSSVHISPTTGYSVARTPCTSSSWVRAKEPWHQTSCAQ